MRGLRKINNKFVSVCINVYNGEKSIFKTLESVCAQTYKELQIIVVDDGSTDNTISEVKRVGDSRIELYSLEKNGHISNANNETYAHIKGEYMVHIDADDVMQETLIEKTVGFLEQNLEYGACFCLPLITDENGGKSGEEFNFLQDIFNVSAKTQAEFVRLFFDSSNHISYSGATIRKSVIEKIGLHNLSLCYLHDFDYWTRLVLEYPIYIINEPLVEYRMDTSGSHNSVLNDAKRTAHNNEFVRIICNMIDNCPNELFLEAFEDKLRFKGPHTPVEAELEKAFLLLDGIIVLPNNKAFGLAKLSKLFEDKKYVEAAEKHFGFRVHDLYRLQSEEIYLDKSKWETALLTAQHERNLAEAKAEELSGAVAALNEHNAALSSEIALCRKLPGYFVLRALRKLYRTVKSFKSCFSLRGRNGKKYRKSVMLYGFFGMNLGDDLFFEKLLCRYPDTLFLVYSEQNYTEFFDRFDNAKFFFKGDSFIESINRIGQKLRIRDLFEYLLLYRSKATVHIGGSIYQQVGEWELDFKLRKRRKQPLKPFFSISSNFGAYETEEYKETCQ